MPSVYHQAKGSSARNLYCTGRWTAARTSTAKHRASGIGHRASIILCAQTNLGYPGRDELNSTQLTVRRTFALALPVCPRSPAFHLLRRPAACVLQFVNYCKMNFPVDEQSSQSRDAAQLGLEQTAGAAAGAAEGAGAGGRATAAAASCAAQACLCPCPFCEDADNVFSACCDPASLPIITSCHPPFIVACVQLPRPTARCCSLMRFVFAIFVVVERFVISCFVLHSVAFYAICSATRLGSAGSRAEQTMLLRGLAAKTKQAWDRDHDASRPQRNFSFFAWQRTGAGTATATATVRVAVAVAGRAADAPTG